jgi:hypothetical protein
VKSWSTFDASLSFDFGAVGSWAKGARLILSASNLLDAKPPLIAPRSATSPFLWDPTNASIVGRVGSLQVITDL